MKNMVLWLAPALLVTAALQVGCSDYKDSAGKEHGQHIADESDYTVKRFRETDPSLKEFFETSVGYAVFPEVAKGAAGIGAAHGNGVLYENGSMVGYSELAQGSIGVQLGGQVYSELVFFENERSLNDFKQGNLEFAAQASAVAAAEGAAANADYDQGVAVFTMGQQGLMFEASIGGQKFSYTPKP
jgi:lipid-binding SYLF domain-containing protein